MMVRDLREKPGAGNWVFVPLSCLKGKASELPEGSGEKLPAAPTVTTGGYSNLAPQAVTLHWDRQSKWAGNQVSL